MVTLRSILPGALIAPVLIAATACSGTTNFHTAGATASPSPQAASQAPASGDCYLAASGSDIAVGIDSPTQSCGQWETNLAGMGLNWYPVSSLPVIGTTAQDGDTLGEACDLTDGTQELFVLDGGGMTNGNDLCSQEEANGWHSEGSPGPIAQQEASEQQSDEQASASAAAQSAAASAAAAAQSAAASASAGAVQSDQQLQQDTATLNGDISIYNRDVATAESAYATVKDEPLCSGGTSDQQTYDDAQNVYDDGQAVYDDEQTLSTDAQNVTSDISSLGQSGDTGGYASDISAGQKAETTANKDAAAQVSGSIQSEASALQDATNNCS